MQAPGGEGSPKAGQEGEEMAGEQNAAECLQNHQRQNQSHQQGLNCPKRTVAPPKKVSNPASVEQVMQDKQQEHGRSNHLSSAAS